MLMPFGKYRGLPVEMLPDDYLRWLTTINLFEPLRTHVYSEVTRRGIPWTPKIEVGSATLVDEIIRTGYLTLAKKHHPDLGGDQAKMIDLNQSYDYLREILG